jgi:hypothetical protein
MSVAFGGVLGALISITDETARVVRHWRSPRPRKKFSATGLWPQIMCLATRIAIATTAANRARSNASTCATGATRMSGASLTCMSVVWIAGSGCDETGPREP